MGSLCVGVDTESPDCLRCSYAFPPSRSDPGDPVVNCRITTCPGVLDVSLYGLFGSSSSVTEETSELARYTDGCWVEGGGVKDVADDTEPVRELKKLPIFLVSAGGCGDGTGARTVEDIGGDSGVAGVMDGLVAGLPPFQSLKLHLDELLGSSAFAGVVGGGGVFDNDDPASPTRNSEI
jgi:hypothetical protein